MQRARERDMKKTYQGSCHCGAVKFECGVDLSSGTTRCNCSFCRKARMWFAITKAEDFRLLAGESMLTDYQFTPPGKPEPFLHLCFCSRCGVRPFSRGGVLPQFGGAFYAVNVACLNDATDEELAQAPIHHADGRNDAWQKESSETKYV
jgi:hypothetical protein